jgi:5-formyltetrahydrofolate cyclo-ligase
MNIDQKEKYIIRKSMIQKRNMIPKTEISKKSRVIQYNLINSSEFSRAHILGIYFPIGSEVRTEEIIQNALGHQKTVGLPSIQLGEIKFYRLHDKRFNVSDLITGKFGIKEPKKRGGELNRLDLLIVPGIVFDNKGNRIGYGRGYFDRFIVKANISFSLALGYKFQLVERDLPSSDLDQKIDGLVTEEGIIYF